MNKPNALRVAGFVAAAALSLSNAFAAPPKAPAATSIVIHADKPGAKIDKYVYGQFAEHLGHGIYEGIYVGKDSPIPNTDGFRNDVVTALKDLHVPLVRWPGGCFADEYHWRDGIGPQDQRPVRINTNWGGVPEDNSFGTDEFFRFVEMIGADAYVNANVGTGSPQEMAEWVEYMTGSQDTTLVRMRKANGRDKPYKLAIFAIGNETWGCGGNMRPEYYADLYKRFVTFFKMEGGAPRPELLASGGNDFGTAWVKTLMEQVPPGMMQAISHHYYTTLGGPWPDWDVAIGFDEAHWIKILANTLKVEGMIRNNVAIMDKIEKARAKKGMPVKQKTGFYVDEWGTWYQPTPGSKLGFLVQQNTIRDAILAAANFNIFHKYADRVRMTSIAQMVNVLQAMILTDGPKMLKTPTYYAFQMYVPFQDATMLPVGLKTGKYVHGKTSMPQVSVSAARTKDGDIVVGLVNFDPNKPAPVSIAVTGAKPGDVSGTVLTADAMDAHNTFDNPDAVHPVPFAGAGIVKGKLTLTLPPKSVVVLHVK